MTETRQQDGFRIEIDPAAQRGDIILNRPPFNTVMMPQRDELRQAFEALDADDRVRIIVLRAMGEHFSSGGYIKGFYRGLAGNRIEVGVEYRCTGAVFQTGDRRQSRVLFRCWFRNFPRLRIPYRLGNGPVCLTGAEAWANSRFRRIGPAAEDYRRHPHQGHGDAVTPHSGEAGLRLGDRY